MEGDGIDVRYYGFFRCQRGNFQFCLYMLYYFKKIFTSLLLYKVIKS